LSSGVNFAAKCPRGVHLYEAVRYFTDISIGSRAAERRCGYIGLGVLGNYIKNKQKINPFDGASDGMDIHPFQ
jgi:hypothetical protein